MKSVGIPKKNQSTKNHYLYKITISNKIHAIKYIDCNETVKYIKA